MDDDEIIEITENSEIDEGDNSDCEIQEEEVPLIEVMGSDDDDVVEENYINENSVIELDINEPILVNETTNENEMEMNSLGEDPLFLITFNEGEQFQELKDCIISGLKTCLRSKGIYIDAKESDNLDIYVYKKNQPDNDEIIDTNANDVVDNEKETTPNKEDKEYLDTLFSIDTTPTEKLDTGTIPSYKRSIKDTLNNDAKRLKKGDECTRPKLANNCFNCNGDHSLKDCPEPRNQNRISKARRQFMDAKGFKGEKRYHIDIEQRFAHIKPGKFSDDLRRALGLGTRDLPSFIYRMRILGYPPGWLEDAKVAHSGIALFDSEGRKVLESDDEEGEVDVKKHKYDTSKIISFPGFNTDPQFDYFDDHRHFGAPSMQRRDRKEEFIKSLGDNIVKGYKRKKLKDLNAPAESLNITNSEPTDMEVEDVDKEVYRYNTMINPPLPDGFLLGQPPPPLPSAQPPPPPLPTSSPPPPLPSSSSERSSRPPQTDSDRTIIILDNDDLNMTNLRDSPSVEDLEAKRKQLLEALQSSSTFLDATAQEDSLIDEVLELEDQTSSEAEIITEERIAKTTEVGKIKISTDPEITTNTTAVETTISKTKTAQTTTINSSSVETESELTTTTATIEQEQNNSDNNDFNNCNSPKTPAAAASFKKSSILGTPLLKFSPYEKLPEGDQFKKGVSDVINFENLPDSTGKYDKIKVVIQKVRKIVTKLNNDN